MNHPTREEWISYLYGETDSTPRHQLRLHLRQCPSCQAQVSAWNDARAWLGSGEPAGRMRGSGNLAMAVRKWGLAACLLILIGFTAGRWTSPAPDLESMRASLAKELRQNLRKDLAQDRQADQHEMASWLIDVEKRRFAEYAALRKDLETVAVVADVKFQKAQQDIGQLATLTRTNYRQND